MKIFVLALVAICLAYSEISTAQVRKKPGRTVTGRATARTEIQRPSYQLRLKIITGGRMMMSITSVDDTQFLSPPDLNSFITDLPTGADKWNRASTAFPDVIVDADPDLTILDVFNPITLFRRDRTSIRIEIPDGPTLVVPDDPKDSPSADIKPDPLRLIVDVDEKGMLSLNHEPAGSLRDTGSLTNRLVQVFREREQNGVFRPGKNEIEKKVTIRMPLLDHKFREAVTIARAVRLAGSNEIDLSPKFDDDDERRELIPAVPDRPEK